MPFSLPTIILEVRTMQLSETAECHAILYNAGNQSPLLNLYNHQPRMKLTWVGTTAKLYDMML